MTTKSAQIDFHEGQLYLTTLPGLEGVRLFKRTITMLKQLFPHLADAAPLMSASGGGMMTALYDAANPAGVSEDDLLRLCKGLLRGAQYTANGRRYELDKDSDIDQAFEGDPMAFFLAAFEAGKFHFGAAFGRLSKGKDPLA